MKPINPPKLSFNELYSFFANTTGQNLSLQVGAGSGSIKLFKPENGLRINIWDCQFAHGVELYSQTLADNEQNFFVLAYFLEPQSPFFQNNKNRSQQIVPQNSFFVSAASKFSLILNPLTPYRCVSISFSRKWLIDVLLTNSTLQPLKDMISEGAKLEVYQSMIPTERTILEDLFFDATKEQVFRTFYIKTAALQLVCDFLYRLKDEQPFLTRSALQITPDNMEQWLCEHITKEFPGTRAMSQQFSVSESTLKRHFRKKFGVTISAYITNKKMQHAKCLVEEQGITVADAARMLGYRSVQNFKEIFAKYHCCTLKRKEKPINKENISCS